MQWEEVEDPSCGPDDVLVAVQACGVNHSDLNSRAGTSRWPFSMPWVLGAEFAGTVAEVGTAITGIAAGDPVTAYQQYACGSCRRCVSWREDLCERFTVLGTDCWGGYAELVRVPARAVIPLRSEGEFVPAASSHCTVGTAWSMVTAVAKANPGESVLVPSASGRVPSAIVQAAKIAGARVVASVGSPEKADFVRALGADTVFCYRDTSVADAVSSATDGEGVGAVLDTVGGPLFSDHLAALRPDGRLVTCGAHAGEVVSLDVIELFRNGRRIVGFRIASPEEIRTSLALALDGRITVPVAQTFALSDAGAAHAVLDERGHVDKVKLVRE
jgi:NADPH:quinone reductase-like Zn-dependent oxidoreductase